MKMVSENIPSYTYGTSDVPPSPISLKCTSLSDIVEGTGATKAERWFQ